MGEKRRRERSDDRNSQKRARKEVQEENKKDEKKTAQEQAPKKRGRPRKREDHHRPHSDIKRYFLPSTQGAGTRLGPTTTTSGPTTVKRQLSTIISKKSGTEQQPERLGEELRYGMLDGELMGEERLREVRNTGHGMVNCVLSGEEERRKIGKLVEHAEDRQPGQMCEENTDGEHVDGGMAGQEYDEGVMSREGEENVMIKVSTSVQYDNLCCGRMSANNSVPGHVCEVCEGNTMSAVCAGGADDDGGEHAPPDAEKTDEEDEILGLVFEMTDAISEERFGDLNHTEHRRRNCSLAGELKSTIMIDENHEGEMKTLDRHAKSDTEAVPGTQLKQCGQDIES